MTDLSVHLSASENALFVYLGLALLERVRSAPNCLAYKMLLGRLVNSGIPVRELERTFGHEHRTLARWGAALLRDDPEFALRAFAGQGAAPKVTGPVAAFVRGRYAQLKGTVREYRRQIAAEVRTCFGVDLSRETLRVLFAGEAARGQAGDSAAAAMDAAAAPPADLRGPAETVAPGREAEAVGAPAGGSVGEPVTAAVGAGLPPPGPVAEVRDSGCPIPVLSEGIGAGSDNHSPAPPGAAGTGLATAADRPGPGPGTGMAGSGQAVGFWPQAVHHAGQILFSPWFDLIGRGRDPALAMQSQWLGQILQGAVNIEQSKSICAASLSRFTGPVVPGPETRRWRSWRSTPGSWRRARGRGGRSTTTRTPSSTPGSWNC